MGACYSKKAGQLGEAYSYPVRQGSPARYRKKTMNRTAPYPRGTAPPHSFGFRRRAAAVTSHRVTPADSAPASRRANGSAVGVTSHRVTPADSAPSSRRANGSQESVLSSSSGSDANGNTQRCATVPPRRLLPRPQVAHVKPRTATSAAPRPNRATTTKLNDSGLGATRGSLASTTASDKDEHDKLIKQEMAPMATSEEFHDVGESVESGGSDFQVGIRTDGATIALSVNIHKGANAAVSRPQVTVSDPAIKARVTQIQRPGFGFTQPAGLTRPPGLSHAASSSATSSTAAPTSTKPSGIPASRSSSNLHTRPSRPSMVPQPATRATAGASVGVTSPPAGGNKRSVALPVARPTHSILEQTVRSRVTRWEEKVHQFSQDALLVAQPRASSQEPAVTMATTAPASTLSPTTKTGPKTVRVASPVTPGALQRCLPGSISSSPIALSTPISTSVQQPTLLPSSGRKPDLKPKPTEAVNSIVQLRREMRQLTRDVATSPLHRPRLRDTGTCTEATTSPPRSQVSQGSGDLSPVLSAMQSSRSGIEDFIDDEIGDQPAFGAAYRAGAMSDSTHSDGFIDDVLTGVGLSLGAEPLPPLEITEAVKSCDVSDYVRPFRLTPRPVAALTTLETPLRRPAAESGTTTSARRQQMEERAERLARRLHLQTPGSAAAESDSDSGLGSTYQRLGLKDPVLSDSDPPAVTTEEDVTESHDTLSPEHSLPCDTDETGVWSKPATKLDSFSPSRGYSSTDAARSRGSDCAESLESRDPARPQDDEMLLSEYSREALKESHDSFTEIPRGFSLPVSRESQPREDRPTTRVFSKQELSDSGSEPSGEYSRQGSREFSRQESQESRVSCDSTREESLESRSSCGRRSGGKAGSAEREDREEESNSDLESQDEAFVSLGGCRPRAASYRRVSELREDVTSPTASVGSDDLMADFDKDSDTLCEDEESVSGQVSRLQRMRLRSSTDGGRPSPDPGTGPAKLLKPPRQSSQGDGGDWLLIDRDTYMYMAQDFTHTKTMLHKLRRLLQDAETANPFENSIQSGKRGPSVSSESQLSSIDGRTSLEGRPALDGSTCDLAAENADLKRQVASLQSQLEERDHTIHLLQQQMAKYAAVPLDVSTVATQATQPVSEDPQVITVCAGK